MTRINLTILTALVAALEALDWLAICEKLEEFDDAKINELNMFISKIMVVVEMTSRKKKKDRKYPSITTLDKMISMLNMHITAIFMISIVLSALASKKAVRKSSANRE